MGKKKRNRNGKKQTAPPAPDSPGGWKLNNWAIVAGILFFIAAGLLASTLLTPGGGRNGFSARQTSQPAPATANLENNVRLVAANFRCACGQCGELPLIDCTCDSPRGAREAKDFIRTKLRQGLSVEQVILQVEQVYGHRIA